MPKKLEPTPCVVEGLTVRIAVDRLEALKAAACEVVNDSVVSGLGAFTVNDLRTALLDGFAVEEAAEPYYADTDFHVWERREGRPPRLIGYADGRVNAEAFINELNRKVQAQKD